MANVILDLFVDDEPTDFTNVYSQLKWFLEGNTNDNDVVQRTEAVQRNVRVIDYNIDAIYIIAGFRQYYNIDLFNTDDMHWWVFKSLLMGIDNKSEIKQRIYYRGVDVGSIKDKNERKRIAKIQNDLRLETRELSDDEIASVF